MILLHQLKETRMGGGYDPPRHDLLYKVRGQLQKKWEGKAFKPVGNVVCVGIVVLSSGVARGGW